MMTELTKQFEVEMNWSLEQAKKDHKVGIFLHAYIEWLESQLTWRPVSEKPEESDYYIARFRFYGDNFISVGMLEYCTDRGWIPDVEVVEWFNIPPAPQGE